MAHPKTNPITEYRYIGSRNMAQIHSQVPRYATRLNASNDHRDPWMLCASIRSHLPSLFNAHLQITVAVAGSRSPLGCYEVSSTLSMSTAMLGETKERRFTHTPHMSLLQVPPFFP
jgi:hypothetical protein